MKSFAYNTLVGIITFSAWFFAWHAIENAYAYRPGGQKGTTFATTAVTVGVASGQAIAADGQRSALVLCNASAAATIFWSTGTFGAAAMNTAGSVPLTAQTCYTLDGTKMTDSINMIASGAGTPATILTID